MGVIYRAGVAPSIPTRVGIEHESHLPAAIESLARDSLGIEEDNPVVISPSVVLGHAQESFPLRRRSADNRKRDRHAADSRLATVGGVDVTGVRHADATGIACELVRFPDKSQARALLKWSVASICPECANTSVSISSKPTHGNGVHVSGFMQLYTAVHALSLCAVIRSSSQHTGADHSCRVRDMKVHGHVSARRDPGSRGLAQVGAEAR